MIRNVFDVALEGHLIASIIKRIKKRCTKIRKGIDKLISIPLIYIYSRCIRVEGNTILFITTRGDYECNAKWICNEILRRNLPYEIYWTNRKSSLLTEFPDGIHLVCRKSIDFYRAVSKAKIIVDNSISLSYMWYPKKRKQVLIETWHGSLGIKMFSRETNKDKGWCFHADLESRKTDYCISNSTFENSVFLDTFWKNATILQLGHARNDILCESGTERLTEIRKKVYAYFSLNDETRICLYAPTFRDDGDMRPYQLDFLRLRRALQTRFGGEWVIMTRFHFKLLNHLPNAFYFRDTINASQYPDIQELLTCTDVGITDYSSWICDYLLTRRPGFLFATDMEEYEKKDREFFYPLDSMPFPLALNNEQLYENILNFDEEVFGRKCEEFLSDKGCIDDGHASERIVDAIERIMKGETI